VKAFICTVLFATALSGAHTSFAQLSTKSKKAIELYTEADNYRVRRQFAQAIDLLNQAIAKDNKFLEAYYRLGLVYFNMRSYPRAIAQFEKALSLTDDVKKQKVIWFDLGEAYLLEGQYEKARDVLALFLKNETQSRPRIDRARMNLKTAEFGLENKEAKSGFRQRALSDTVNRFVMQYFPVLTADQQQLIFTRRTGFRDEHDEDLVMCLKDESGRWKPPVSISAAINTDMNEGTCSISADGRRLIFTSCAGRDSYGSCDLYETRKVGNEWSTPKNLGPLVNTAAWESQPSLSADGRTLYFVSERRSGLGRRDIWFTTIDENGHWTKAMNAGTPINSEFDEMSPFIHVNNKTLFFATNAREGFGGYDVFFTEHDTIGWSNPRNIGSPINNHDDQFSLFITADGKRAYYSHEETKEDGRSYSKIFEAEIPEESWLKFRSNYVKGIVRDRETKQLLSARIELIDLATNKVESLVESDSVTGSYLMVLTQGAEYALYVTRPGYLFKSLNFNYSEIKNFEPIILDVELDKVRQGTAVVLNNIFFDVDKFDLKEKSKPELMKVIRFLNDNPALKIEIGGHTDNTGSTDYNVELSEKRATAVYRYLVENGIHPNRVRKKGYGPAHPVAENTSEEGRKFNRRIEFAIVK
jgi:OmpA-OmpF porin, OOP family